MIISQIELKNVVGLYNGCGLDKIKIKFDNDYSKIILVIGKNGSGKSTLVNSLDPFAVETIREGKEGYKKIIYKDKNTKYVIEHYYKPTKTGHNVKSYIVKTDKNGDKYELNANGNSTSFNEIVESELGVSKSSMKLIKMGVELGSMVTMTPAERKKFINVFTAETDIYNRYYKKINDDFRTIKKILQNTENKITNIGNIDSIKTEFKICTESLDNIEETISSNKNKRALILNELNELRNKYISDNIDYTKLNDLTKNKSFLKYVDTDFDKLSDDIRKLKSTYDKYKNDIDMLKECINKNSNDIITIEDEISNISEMLSDSVDIDIDELNEQKVILQNKIDNYSSWFYNLPKNFKEIDRDSINKIVLSLSEYRQQFLSIFDDNNIDKKLLYDFGINNDYTKILSDVYAEKNMLSQDIIKTENDIAVLKNDIKKECELLDKKPKNCNNLSCPLLKGVSQDILDKKMKLLEDKVKNKKYMYERMNELESYTLSVALCKQLKDTVLRLLKTISNEDVDSDEIITSCIQSINSCNSNILKEYIDMYKKITEELALYQEIKDAVNKLNNITLDINKSKFSESMKKRRDSLINDINKINSTNKELMSKYKEKIKDFENINIELTKLNEIYEMKDDVNEYKLNINIIKEMEDNNNKITILCDKLAEVEKMIYDNENIRNDLLSQKDKLSYKKKYYQELSRYRKVVLDNYGKLEVIHEALSINEGIPLIFIKTLLKKIRANANKLLKSAFGDNLKLKKFKIDEKEFNMPIIGKGDGVKDVRYASSGERSIIGLAISLALSQYVNSKYNIVLIDELDGPLDFNLRRSFLEILEYQCKMMDIKQVFNISHNGTFNDYRANLVALKGADYINMKEKNILYKIE